ncbi:hypothetical protein AwWohl_01320 [Gammaproteobacteria bacterium]|nr:hypothetical protein AwWohl_01320 [Gammaproteobacteria bacterium]
MKTFIFNNLHLGLMLGLTIGLTGCLEGEKSGSIPMPNSERTGASYQESRPYDEERGLRKYDANNPAIARAKELGVAGMIEINQTTADQLYTMDAMAASGTKCDGSPSIKLEIYQHDFDRKDHSRYKAGYANWNDTVVSIAGSLGMDPNLIHAIISVESAYKEKAIGPKTKYGTAKGLMQLLDSTAAQWGAKNPNDLLIGQINIKSGSKYLNYLIKRFKGNVTLAIASYNAGFGNIERCGNRITPYAGGQTLKYTRHALGFANHYKLSRGY